MAITTWIINLVLGSSRLKDYVDAKVKEEVDRRLDAYRAELEERLLAHSEKIRSSVKGRVKEVLSDNNAMAEYLNRDIINDIVSTYCENCVDWSDLAEDAVKNLDFSISVY